MKTKKIKIEIVPTSENIEALDFYLEKNLVTIESSYLENILKEWFESGGKEEYLSITWQKFLNNEEFVFKKLNEIGLKYVVTTKQFHGE